MNNDLKKEVHFIEITPEGQSKGIYGEKVVYAYGVLPDETVGFSHENTHFTSDLVRKKKKYIIRTPQVTQKSKHRIEPKENHYLSCSPFQIADYDYQIELKKEMLKKCFIEYADTNIYLNDFHISKDHFGYRTKLEFSFAGEGNSLTLAFFERNKKFSRITLDNGCALGSEGMNMAALKVVEWLQRKGFREHDLKTLTLRESKYSQEIIALLLFKKEYEIDFSDLDFKNIIIGFSSPKSPASNLDKIWYQSGVDYLEEEVRGFKIKYPYDGFFQNNIELFDIALDEIRASLADLYKNKISKIIELYSGVGTIGIALNDLAEEIVGVEIIESAVEYAKTNAEINNISNYKAIFSASEKIDFDILNNADILILDPPRVGLHPKVIKQILEKLPQTIIYLSCNPITQAKDYNLLKESYDIKSVAGFDFYPNTPHMECLLTLVKKAT